MHFSINIDKDKDKNKDNDFSINKEGIKNLNRTNILTDFNEPMSKKSSLFKNNNNIITDNTDNSFNSRNKEYKKSVTSYNPKPQLKESSCSVNTNDCITPTSYKRFNKMNTRISYTNRNVLLYNQLTII